MVDARINQHSMSVHGLWIVGMPWLTVGLIMSLYFFGNRDYALGLIGVAIAIAGVVRSYVWLKGSRSFNVEVLGDTLKVHSKGVLHEYPISSVEYVELHKGSSPLLIMTGPIYDLPYMTVRHRGEESQIDLFLLFDRHYVEFVKVWERESITPLRLE